MGKSTLKKVSAVAGTAATKQKASSNLGAAKPLKAITALQEAKQTPNFAFGETIAAASNFSAQPSMLLDTIGQAPPRLGTDVQAWSFRLSDFHRTTPEEERRAFLSGLEIPVYKHLERLAYATKWGLDPGYVIVT